MFAAAGVLSGAALLRWGGERGTGLLLLAVAVSFAFLFSDVRALAVLDPAENRCLDEGNNP
jgi:hypothetical protein